MLQKSWWVPPISKLGRVPSPTTQMTMPFLSWETTKMAMPSAMWSVCDVWQKHYMGGKKLNRWLSLASISLDKALQLDINGAAMLLADEPQGSVGIRVRTGETIPVPSLCEWHLWSVLVGWRSLYWSNREVSHSFWKDIEYKKTFTDSFWWSSTQETDLLGERSVAMISRSPRIWRPATRFWKSWWRRLKRSTSPGLDHFNCTNLRGSEAPSLLGSKPVFIQGL